MKYCLKSKNSKDLIVFFCGWGMDEKPLLPLSSKTDILHVYDYNDLNLDFDFSGYQKISLIAFSCGVFMAHYLKDKLPKFGLKVAINGTLKPFDEKFGLTQEKIKMFSNISKDNYLDFRENLLIKNKKELQLFNRHQPHRTLRSSHSEFKNLKRYYLNQKKESSFYDKILISEDDKIMPAEIQKNFWGKNYKIIPGAHFPFYNFNSMEEILEY